MTETKELNDDQMTARGEEIARVLGLKKIKSTGWYETTRGNKTARGLFLTVKDIIETTR